MHGEGPLPKIQLATYERMPTIHTINDTQRAIYIDLQRSHEFFTNNDVVRGAVCVHPTARPNGIRIAFKGRCKSYVTKDSPGRHPCKSTLELFCTQRLLFNSSTHDESYAILNRGIGSRGNVELSFEFHFPNEVEMAPGHMYRPRPGFEDQKGHPLPTSMDYSNNKVEYLLEVLVYKKVEWSPDEIITLALPFRPTAAATTSNAFVERPSQTDFCIRGHHLNPSNEQNPNALTKLKWATLSKYQHAIPEASWRIIARCPILLVTGNRVPIFFSFYHLGHSSELLEAPTVYVRQIRVKLTSILTVRVPYAGATGERDVIEDIEKEILSEVFIATDCIMRHSLQLADIGEFRLPPTVLPSFKTYGLRLVYRIKVVVEGDCMQEAFSVVALRDYCKVVCDVRRLEREETIASAGSTNTSTLRTSDQVMPVFGEQLPAYESAPSYDDAPLGAGCESEGVLTRYHHQNSQNP